jgi:hypothetical protein
VVSALRPRFPDGVRATLEVHTTPSFVTTNDRLDHFGFRKGTGNAGARRDQRLAVRAAGTAVTRGLRGREHRKGENTGGNRELHFVVGEPDEGWALQNTLETSSRRRKSCARQGQPRWCWPFARADVQRESNKW